MVLERGTQPHFVYFIAATPVTDRWLDVEAELQLPALVKIGTTTDVEKRLQHLMRGDATKLADWMQDGIAAEFCLLGCLEGDRELEGCLHKAFANHCAGGEWFYLDEIDHIVNDLLDDYCCCHLCRFLDEFQQLPVDVQRQHMDLVMNSPLAKDCQ